VTPPKADLNNGLHRIVKRIFLIALFLWMAIGARAQQQTPAQPASVEDLLGMAEQWAKDNLDDEALAFLSDVDRDQVRGFLVDLENRFQTNSVYDLGALNQRAKDLVPFLEQWEETLPLVEWLKTRLDYLEVSEELKRAVPTPKPTTPTLPKPSMTTVLPPPTLTLERSLWKKQFEKRPLPPKAQLYVPRLKEIFTAEKMPPELVWVAEIESAFNPNARSPVGAAGLFQLMKPTAKSYGLSTFFPDERTDPDKNARAAARYLRYLHTRFGDWSLALAAYNAGETRVDKLLKAANARDYSGIANKLPAETQMYVPKCEAALRKREGIGFGDLKMPAG